MLKVEEFRDVYIDYCPHSKQQEFHNDNHRFRVLACGTRWGKERSCVPEMIKKIHEQSQEPGRKSRNLVPNIHWWAIAPTYALTKQLWMELKYFTPKEFIETINETEKYIRWKKCYGGALIEMKSAHRPDELVSVGLDGVLITETGLVKRAVWEDSVRGRLASRQGIGIFNGTPRGKWESRGKKSLLYDMYLKGQDPEATEWMSWRYPSWTNPYIPQAEINSMRKDMDPKLFSQNVAAEFIDFAIGKAVYGNDWNDKASIPVFKDWDKKQIVIRGWDRGYHHPACVWTYINGEDQLCVAKEFMGVDITRNKFIEKIIELSASWFPGADFIDWVPPDFKMVESDGYNWSKIMASNGISVRIGKAGKDEVVRRTDSVRTKMKLRQDGKFGMLVDPSCEILIDGFGGAYHYPEIIDRPEDEKPYKDGFYDHLQDSMAVICDNHYGNLGQKKQDLKTLRFGKPKKVA